MKSENGAVQKNDSAMIEILAFDAKYADDILDIQTECGLSVWLKNDYLGELEREDSIFNIALAADEKVIGFALVRLLIGANGQKNSAIKFNSSEIINIAVCPCFQHQGIGQMIFDEIVCELECQNISEIWLEVRKSNANAINFYRKNKFEMQFERKNYYTNPTENAFIFRCLMNH
ncbi:MAG: ribosomal protein S18-alanine N-acetyltransferase [Acidobacteriota bacterium]